MYCFCCPNKGQLVRNWTVCRNCSTYYHKSCADRVGNIALGVVKKCCKDKSLVNANCDSTSNLSQIEYNSTTEVNNSSVLSDQIFHKNQNMATKDTISTFDELWSKIEQKIDNSIGKKLTDLSHSVDTRFKSLDERLTILEPMSHQVLSI